jgi:hypothetical protein
MDVKNVFNAINCLNQAINPKFLGPLFLKGVLGLFNVSSLGLDLVPLLDRGPRRAKRAAMLDV